MKIGIVFMAYGTPSTEEEILPYYTDILGGRRPSEAMYQELLERYRKIGFSPLAKISEEQRKGTINELKSLFPQYSFIGTNGYRHVAPFVDDAVRQLVKEGIDYIIGCALTPQYARHSTQLYHDAALAELEKLQSNIPYLGINEWHQEPPIVDYWAQEIVKVVNRISDSNYCVVYSAHNLPLKQIIGDVYEEQFKEMGSLIAERAGIPIEKCAWAWQSGHEGGPIEWMRPFLEELVEEKLQQGIKHILSVPIGFISDNLEISYDLDIELKELVEEGGGTLHRLPMPNAHPLLINALVNAISLKLKDVEKLSTVK